MGVGIKVRAIVVENLTRIRVEDVRTIDVDQQSGIVMAVIGVTRDVPALVDNQHLLPRTACDPLGEN